MPINMWEKYAKIKDVYSNKNIKTCLVSIEPLMKEIIPKNKDDYYIIKERLEILKNQFKIYEILEEEEDKFFIFLENNNELSSEIDKLLLSNELDVIKEGSLEGHGKPIKKEELSKLFNMEKAMCKISFNNVDKKAITNGKGSGFFCEMNIDNFPFKYALFTNNHILNKSSIEIDNIIKFEDYKKEKEIKILKNRKVYTNEELDYTCIQILNSDDINHFFKIDPNIFKYNRQNIKNTEIFILQYPNGNDISFSNGKILTLDDYNKIHHSASTESGSSGSPIIRRCEDFFVIGLHFGGIIKNENKFIYNLATPFDIIINDIINNDIKSYNKINFINKNKNKNINNSEIKGLINEINCIYNIEGDNNVINLLHNYNITDFKYWDEEVKKSYLEAKNINTKFYEDNIELYINGKKNKFTFQYKNNSDLKEIKVKFIFKKNITNTSFMFYNCSSLKKIDLSSFDTRNVTSMRSMFEGCSYLKLIDLSLFNTEKVTNMSFMFAFCSSLNSLNLSSFNTNKVINMSRMFTDCSSLKSLDLSSFNTNKVNDMWWMLHDCSSLNKNNIRINSNDNNILKVINELTE